MNLGQRDLAGVQIERIEGILNLTANYILARMADDGLSFEQALAEAQAAGQAETDPRLDVEGWDSASKLVILANSVLGQPATLADVAVGGMAHLTGERLREAAAQGKRIKLIATAQRREAGYDLAVQPAWLDADHPWPYSGRSRWGRVLHGYLWCVVRGHPGADAAANGGCHVPRHSPHLWHCIGGPCDRA